MSPQRIQLRRTKGWKMPANTKKVDRTTNWGNRWVVREVGALYKPARYVEALPDPKELLVIHLDKWGHRDGMQFGGFGHDRSAATRFAVDVHARSLHAAAADLDGLVQLRHWLQPLRGYDLGCWCPPDAPCHADTLLELTRSLFPDT